MIRISTWAVVAALGWMGAAGANAAGPNAAADRPAAKPSAQDGARAEPAGVDKGALAQPVYGPEPAWARPAAIPLDMKPSGAAADVLLLDVQDRLGPQGTQSFVERAIRINAPEGLQPTAAALAEVWNPATDTLAIHRARVLRDGKVIDLLDGGRRFTVLRRETNLEAAAIDGDLTATLQPEGLRVGDVLDLAVTLTRKEPALAGHAEGGASVAHAGVIGRLVVRTQWPAGQPFHVWKTDDLPTLAPATHDGWTEIGFEQAGAVSPEPPKGASAYDRAFGLLSVNDFRDWREVSAVSWPLYDKAATLAPDSPLRDEIARIRSLGPDPKLRALAALKLVEGQTRYFFVGLDAGGYTPAAADLTWNRRFGDCKGKTVLLLALLRGLGVPAQPALVSTAAGEALDRQLPSMGAFDHVIVKAEIGGRTYWLDGTRMGDENLDVIPVPNFHWALPLAPEGASLTPVGPQPPALPYGDAVLKIDLSGGLDTPAPVQAEIVMRGDLALFLDQAMKKASPADQDRALRQMFINGHSWFKPAKVGFSYDPQTMQGRATAEGAAVLPFISPNNAGTGVRDWTIEGSSIGYEPDFVRTSDYHRNAPYEVAYPLYFRSLVEVKLPAGGKAFEVDGGETVNRTTAGMAYSRSAAIADGKLVMVASSRAVAASFPAADAEAAAAALRSLADYVPFLRYTPPAPKAATPASTLASTPAPALAQAADADPLAAAEAAFARQDYAAAEAGFTAALSRTRTAKLYYDRGAARAERGELDPARSDFQAALAIDPKDAFASFALGRLALKAGDVQAATRRFADAARDAAKPGDMAVRIAKTYEAANRYAEAYPYWDRATTAAPDAAARASALNAACWARGEAGVDLDQALVRCNHSLALAPSPATLDSRALVELRLGALDKATADYSAALAQRPEMSTSLFGRALAERRLGRANEAAADLDKARQLDPSVTDTFRRFGLTP